MRCNLPLSKRVDPKILECAKKAGMQQANELIEREEHDALLRAINMVMLAMAWIGLSPKTGKRVVDCLTSTIFPLWRLATEGDDAGKKDGDFTVAYELEKRGWKPFKLETEM